jgi:hypothetical protein
MLSRGDLARLLPRLGLCVASVALALAMLARLGGPRLERAIRTRLKHEAMRHGLVVHVEAVHVGFWPPIRLKGVRLETSGGCSVAADSLDFTLRLRGSGLLGRTSLALGRVTLIGPGGLVLEIVPTLWEVTRVSPDAFRAELRQPAQGLSAMWIPIVGGRSIEVRGTEVPAGRLLTVRRDGAPILDGGVLQGYFRVASTQGSTAFNVDLSGRGVRLAALSNDAPVTDSEAPAFGQPTDIALRLGASWRPLSGSLEIPWWYMTSDGVALSGSLTLADVPRDPRVDFLLEVERVDFARLFQTSGLDQPEAMVSRVSGPRQDGDLGSASLSARVSGRLADPASFVVSQQLGFVPPRRPLPALARLRGDFVQEVLNPGSGRKRITVSPASPDFIAIGDVPPLFIRTLLIGEDSGFFGHRGIDLSEVPSAILRNWTRGGVARGASTITQQLAKNLFLSREKRLRRKLLELSLALLLEATLSKERILEIYLNIIEWGPDLHGLRPAAERYFHKEPGDLSPKQMAFLVALIPGPLKYQGSFADGTLSPGFRQLVNDLLAKLRSIDALTEGQYQDALADELVVDTAHAGSTETMTSSAPSQRAEEDPREEP